MKNTFDKLRELRILYEEEKKQRHEEYSRDIKDAKESYNLSLSVDFVDEEKLRFEMSLESLEELYQDLVGIYKRTKGLTFSIVKHIETVNPRPVPHGGVNGYFDRIVEDCNGALDAIERNTSPEQDIAPIKVFCQGLVDLRYVVKNARRLVEDVGDTDRKKAELLATKKQAVKIAEQKYEEAMRLENFDCYAQLKEFSDKVLKEYSITEGSMLSNKPIKARNDNKFLMGFYTADIPSVDLKFAESVLKLPGSAFATNPIYFDLNADHTALLINAPALFYNKSHKFFNNENRKLEFNKLINNIYLSILTNMPAKSLLFAGVESEDVGDAVLGGLELFVENKIGGGIFGKKVRKHVDVLGESIPELFDELDTLCSDRSAVYTNNGISDIFDYNQQNPSNADYFVTFIANRYPYGFNSTKYEGRNELIKTATKSGSKGVISIICQESDAKFTPDCPPLTAEELNADEIGILPDGTITYNGKRATLDIRTPDFNFATFTEELKKYLLNASSVWLYDILDKEKKKSEEQKKKDKEGKNVFYKRISVPMGESGGDQFDFTMKTCSTESFALLVGTAGSGKSSFLHTFILSAATKYSPDELQFGLIDFKAEEDSPEFSQYMKKPGVDNLYIPHVNYLMVNGKPECALDLFDMLVDIKTERSRLFSKCGVSELSAYNAHEKVLNNELPKLPVLFFIIDEYNVMLEGDGKRDRNVNRKIVTALTSMIKAVRACGVGILLSGQSVANSLLGEEGALAQINTRISLYTNSVEGYTSLMGGSNVNSRDAKSDVGYLRDKGYSIFTTDAGRTRKQVRHAYAGNTGCDKQLELAREIRQKWGEREQLIAGSESKYPVHYDPKNEFIVGQVNDKRFQIPLGVSSAAMKPQGLEFSTKQDSMNYFAFADGEQIAKIEQNSIFSFLATVKASKSQTSKVQYLSTFESYNLAFDNYLNEFPKLNDYMEVVLGTDIIAKKLIDVYSVFEYRRGIASHERKVFDPMFVIFHDIEWLTDSDESWLKAVNKSEDKAEGETVTYEAAPVTVEDLQKDPKYKGLPLNILQAIASKASKGGSFIRKPEGLKEEGKKVYTAESVRNIFRTLYTRGNRYRIFILVTTSVMDPLNKAVIDKLDANNKNIAKQSFAIYGSQNEMTNGKRDEKANLESVFACPSESKVRLFDYSFENNPGWWNSFLDNLRS